MDVTKMPDITTMSLDEAKRIILAGALRPGDSHDVEIDNLARPLLEAATKRREAAEYLKGSGTRHFYGSPGQQPDAAATAVLYEAAWELVREGLLRPGPRHFGVLNPRDSGFCLREKGRQAAKAA